MIAFVFPGQGSQKVGMGTDLAEASAVARAVFEEVDDALGIKLSAIMRGGPEDQLTLTENAQPAIMANAIATLRVLESEFGVKLADKGACVAGHSLGEYTALCAVGAFDLADATGSESRAVHDVDCGDIDADGRPIHATGGSCR